MKDRWRRFRSEVTQRALVRNALRMRPDRIILGEVRGGEALDMLQAMNTGHEGSMATIPIGSDAARAGAQCAADAAGPHHPRGGARRRSARHAAGDEHWA